MAVESDEVNGREAYERGRAAMEAGCLEDACVEFARSAAVEPHFKTLELLGECHLLLGRHRYAIIWLAAATALNEQSRAPCLLAEAFLADGQPGRATEFARLALVRSPENKRAAQVLAKAGKSEMPE